MTSSACLRRRARDWIRRCAAALLAAASLPAGAATFALPPPDEDLVGELLTVIAAHEDTLPDIARRHGLGYGEIVSANPGVDPWLPGAGTRVLVPARFVLPEGARRGIVVDLARMRLFYFPEPAAGRPREVITLPVGIGREYRLPPLGTTRVTRKASNPTWYPPQWIRDERAKEGEVLPRSVPPGPDNPLGEHALYLGLPGYLIHGTNRPWGIGMRVSGGCVRLYPEDIGPLYERVPVGTPVRITSEPFILGRHAGALHLKVAPRLGDDVDGGDFDLTPVVKGVLARLAPGEQPDWDAAMRATHRRGVVVQVTRAAR
jgi:L,D-transpeptidase ErfK/SrfK